MAIYIHSVFNRATALFHNGLNFCINTEPVTDGADATLKPDIYRCISPSQRLGCYAEIEIILR